MVISCIEHFKGLKKHPKDYIIFRNNGFLNTILKFFYAAFSDKRYYT